MTFLGQSVLVSLGIVIVHSLVSPTLNILSSKECRKACLSLLSYIACCFLPRPGQQTRRESGPIQRHLALEQAQQATAWRREQLCESSRALGQLQAVSKLPPSDKCRLDCITTISCETKAPDRSLHQEISSLNTIKSSVLAPTMKLTNFCSLAQTLSRTSQLNSAQLTDQTELQDFASETRTPIGETNAISIKGLNLKY